MEIGRGKFNYGDLVGTAKKDSRGKRKIGKGHGRGSITQETIGKTSFDVGIVV